MANFGSSLKKAREAKGISLDKIAGETRISTRFLRAIEEEEFQVLPGGIFNRGFVRTYAERVGLDPDQAVAEYERLLEYREPSEPLPPVEGGATSKIERHLYAAAAGALVLLIAIFYIVTSSNDTTGEQASPVVSATAPASSSAPIEPSASSASSDPVQPPSPAAAPAAAQAPLPPVKPLSIEMAAQEKTWILLTTDGKTVTELLMEPGTTQRFTANKSIDITIGNAGGLTLKVNDKPTRRPIGRSGQVRQFVITQENANKIDDIIG